MKNLPGDTILNIISRLPHQSIVYCKLVCKPWRDLLCNTKPGILFMFGGHPEFQGRLFYGGEEYCDDINIREKEYSYKTLPEMHHHDKLEPLWTLSDMVGSCNGLVCFQIKDLNTWVGDPIYICNPVTREYVYLPKYIGEDRDSCGRCAYTFICGFGYSYSTDEYKVVRIYYRSGMCLDTSRVQVYTLGSGQGWRDKGRINHRICPVAHGVCANGAIYWSGFGELVAFDLVDEEFRLIPLPPSLVTAWDSVYLRLLGGYLSAIGVTTDGDRKIAHTWVLKKKRSANSAVEEPVFNDFWCWNEEFVFTWEDPRIGGYVYVPVAVTRSNQVLLWYGGYLFCYDPHAITLNKLWGEEWMIYSTAIPHLNSLVSLEALGEKSKRT